MRFIKFYILSAATLLSLFAFAVSSVDFFGFASDIFSEVAKNKSLINFVISPFALQSALFLVFLGSKGRTREELRLYLRLGDKCKDELAVEFEKQITHSRHPRAPRLLLANRIYAPDDVSITKKYCERLKKFFHVDVGKVNFNNESVPLKINAWVQKVTHNKIKKIINPREDLAQSLILAVCTAYFSGEFDTPFQTKNTIRKKFRGQKRTVIIEFMRGTFKYKYGQFPTLGASVLQIPFRNGPDSLILLLPDKPDGLAKLTKELENLDLITIIQELETTEVKIFLPKFIISTSTALKKPLKKLGIRNIFERSANLTGFTKEHTNLYHPGVTILNHNNLVKFGEMGVGVTGTDSGNVWDIQPPVHNPYIIEESELEVRQQGERFVADHPFIFAVVNENLVYFQGRIANIKQY